MNAQQRPVEFREVVLRAIHAVASGKGFLRDALRREFEENRFPPALRGAVGECASGIIRRRLTLDHLIGLFSDVPLRKIDPLLLNILRLAAYEVLFVERIPVHASVSEAVTLTKKRVRPAFAGFTNAVLRELVRTVEETLCVSEPLPPSPRELPLEPGRVVRFRRDVFPDPDTDFVGFLSARGGMPRWLVERWLQHFGSEETSALVTASNSRPPLCIRVNVLKTTREALVEELIRQDVHTVPGDVAPSLCVTSPVALTALDAFKAGAFYIQDATAMRAALMLMPRESENVLDLCAAPGGKTTHLAEISGDRATILALDQSPERLKRVEENARRLGITNITTRAADARRLDESLKGAFDCVLADVPCSNTGVLRRRVEARHRLRPQTIAEMAEVQAEILAGAMLAARPGGGRVVYSTCSIEPEENHELVRRVLADHQDWTLEAEETVLPRADGPDGGYVARLVSG